MNITQWISIRDLPTKARDKASNYLCPDTLPSRRAARITCWSSIIARFAVGIFLSILAGAGYAQLYPSKPVRLIVPFSSGGGTDLVARLMAQKLSELWGKQVIVDNRPGAASIIGTELVAKSAPDGYTLLMQVNALAANHTIYPKRPYDTLNDFIPVVHIASTPNVLVIHPSMPVKTALDLVALAKRRPDEISYASSGAGSASYLAAELFKLLTGVKMLHVPYKGTGPALVAIISGEVQAMVASLPGTVRFIQEKRLRALGVTSAHRAAAMPELPTLAEAGIKNFEFVTWYGLFAKASVQPEIVSTLNAAINKVLSFSDVKAVFSRRGLEAVGGTQQDFAAYFRVEVDRLEKVVRASRARR